MTQTLLDLEEQFNECGNFVAADDLYRRLFVSLDALHDPDAYQTLGEAHRRCADRLTEELRAAAEEAESFDAGLVHPRVLRAWAATQGITLKARGAVPDAVDEAYRLAHGLSPREPEPPAAEVRSWAADNGVKVAPRGRIDPKVVAQYKKAQEQLEPDLAEGEE